MTDRRITSDGDVRVTSDGDVRVWQPQLAPTDDWPVGLPTLRLPVSLGMSYGVLSTPNDVGPAITRRRTLGDPQHFSHAVRWTAAELAVFRTFWSDTLANGALSFGLSMPAPISTTKTLRFTTRPLFQRSGAHWVATLELEILP